MSKPKKSLSPEQSKELEKRALTFIKSHCKNKRKMYRVFQFLAAIEEAREERERCKRSSS